MPMRKPPEMTIGMTLRCAHTNYVRVYADVKLRGRQVVVVTWSCGGSNTGETGKQQTGTHLEQLRSTSSEATSPTRRHAHILDD